jgi:hypothetical protein
MKFPSHGPTVTVTPTQVLAALKYKALVVSEFSAALQTAHDIWENWAAGASHAGDYFSLGL